METIDNNFLSAIMWYAMGIFSYKIVARLLNYGNMIGTYQEMLLSVLSILKMADKNFKQGNTFLEEASVKGGLKKESAALEAENNENVLNIWREMVINSIILNSTPQFRRLISFRNWSDAMKYLNSEGVKK